MWQRKRPRPGLDLAKNMSKQVEDQTEREKKNLIWRVHKGRTE